MWKLTIFMIASFYTAETYAAATLTCVNGILPTYNAATNIFGCGNYNYNISGITSSYNVVNVPGVPQNAISNVAVLSFWNFVLNPLDMIISIPFVPSNMFHYFPSLVNITLRRVYLKSLNTDAFKNCPKLKKIEIIGNRFPIIPAAFAQTCTNLTELIMNENKITKIDISAFMGLSKLNTLNLQYNRLRCISGSVFIDTPALYIIDLSHNMLTTLDYTLFNGLSKLQRIDLGYNRLTFMSEFVLNGCSSTLLFIFDHNPIDSLSYSHFGTIKDRIPGDGGLYPSTSFSFAFTAGCVGEGIIHLMIHPAMSMPGMNYNESFRGYDECFALWNPTVGTPTVSC